MNQLIIQENQQYGKSNDSDELQLSSYDTSPALSSGIPHSAADSAYGKSPAVKWESLNIPEPDYSDNWRFRILPQDISSSFEVPNAIISQQNDSSPSMYKKHLLLQTDNDPSSSMSMAPWQMFQDGSLLFSPGHDQQKGQEGFEKGFEKNGACSSFDHLASPFESSSPLFASTPFPMSASADFVQNDISMSPLAISGSPFIDASSSRKSSNTSGMSLMDSAFSNPNDPNIMLNSPPPKKRKPSATAGKPKRQHKEGKSFPCEICSSTFSRNHDLKRHIRIHLGIRPYKCDTCPKSFTRMDALSRHKNIRGCKGTEDD